MANRGSLAEGGFSARGIVLNLVVNAAIPTLLYMQVKYYRPDSEILALTIAAIVPLLASVVDIVRDHRLNIIGAIVVLGIAVSLIGIALGGDPRILLIRESLLTGALGVACFVSLLFPRPLMFYFAREFTAGGDPVRIAAMEAQYELIPGVRRVHRRITIVWGFAYAGEFVLRVILVYSLPSVLVLAVSPIILGLITVATVTWTFAYARAARRRAAAAGIQLDSEKP